MGKITTESIRAIVRPILTVAFSATFIAGCVMGAIEPKYLVYITLGILAFWFGERYFSKFASFINSHNQTSTAPAAPPAVVLPPSPPPAAPPPVAVVEAPPEPLDIKAFHEKVLADVEPHRSETNPATIFYEARDKGAVTNCEHISHAQDYWDYLVTLVYAAAAYVKEQTENQLAAAGGCQGVVDPAYVKIQQDLQTTVRNRDHVYTLARSDIDWKGALSPSATLYNVGAQAEAIIRARWEVQ
jgi:hypothetical protein